MGSGEPQAPPGGRLADAAWPIDGGEIVLEVGECSSDDGARGTLARKEVGKSRNNELRELFNGGFGTHHAGMLRADRGLAEAAFAARVKTLHQLISADVLKEKKPWTNKSSDAAFEASVQQLINHAANRRAAIASALG